jgi:Mg-chelatase subunit ChlD
MRLHLRIASLALSLSACIWACTAAPNDVFTSATGGGGRAGAGGNGGSSAANTGGGDIHFDGGGAGDAASVDDAGACTATSAQTALTPLDMIVLLDRSGSMSGSKWTTVTAALKNFYEDPKSAGISVGMVFFPNELPDDCVYSDYAILDVPVGELPANSAALASAIDDHGPTGATPTHGALKGALFAATSHQDMNPTHKVVLVFASDGDPTECSIQDSASIAGLAKSAYNYNGVQTYAIAVPGSTVSNLDMIAVAGGTGQAYDVTQDIMQFAAKMAEIRANALACELIIPPPPMGEQLDPAKVNVKYTPSGQTTGITLPNVTSKAQCGSSAAWYYDDNAAPKKIVLCPAACDQVQSDSLATVDVLFGCKTIAM